MYSGGGERGKRLDIAQRMNEKDTDQNNEYMGNENFSPIVGWSQEHTQPVIQALIRQIPGAEDSLVFCIWPFYYFKFIGLEKICLFLLREY